jgi:hypothetical protein
MAFVLIHCRLPIGHLGTSHLLEFHDAARRDIEEATASLPSLQNGIAQLVRVHERSVHAGDIEEGHHAEQEESHSK